MIIYIDIYIYIYLGSEQNPNKMAHSFYIPNIENYNIEYINGGLAGTPKKQYMQEDELGATEFKYSTIEECLIKKGEQTISTKKKYRSVLDDIWKTMHRQKIKIFGNTTFNVKSTNEHGVNGSKWCDDIQLSVQDRNADGTLKEIIHMVKLNKMTMEMSIELNTGRIVHIKIV